MKYTYQHGFSAAYAERVYDVEKRVSKAHKMIAALEDYYEGGLEWLRVLDVGCSTGIVSNTLVGEVREVHGVDIDELAVQHAHRESVSPHTHFSLQDAMDLALPAETFDVVICAHVYEHVPDADRLLAEIRRVLRPGGVCFFAAGNRLILIEGHYRLPLLAMMPKPLANLYLRLLGRGDRYYENHRTLWGLRRLTADFEVIDYTLNVLMDPEQYASTDLVQPGSLKQRVAIACVRLAYWLCPTYIWLLRKPDAPSDG